MNTAHAISEVGSLNRQVRLAQNWFLLIFANLVTLSTSLTDWPQIIRPAPYCYLTLVTDEICFITLTTALLRHPWSTAASRGAAASVPVAASACWRTWTRWLPRSSAGPALTPSSASLKRRMKPFSIAKSLLQLLDTKLQQIPINTYFLEI